jgi:hypothetical protein
MSHFRAMLSLTVIMLLALISGSAAAEDQPANKAKVPGGAKVYVASIGDGFDTFLKSALAKKKVPVQVVDTREAADYEITGVAESQKASTAKKVLFGDWRSREEASLRLTDVKSSEVVWSYSYNTTSSYHGKQSAAESCAKHLKEAMEAK